MGFLNSLPLWGALAAVGVAVPIIIHLLFRKHRRQTKWAAMELLRRALVTRSGQVRLENYLILFLRCLALFLIAAAMLRPTLTNSALGEQRVGMVVAIDASFSMNHGEPSRFEKAIERAKKVLKNAGEGEPVSLVLMSNRPQVLLRRTAYDPKMFADLLDKQKEATPFRLNLERNLEVLEELVAELKAPVKECYLITDGQEVDWKPLADKAQESLIRLKKMASVFVTPVHVESEANLGLTDLSYASGSLQKSGVARILAKVRNFGRQTSNGGDVEFYVGNDLVARSAVGELKPGETRGVSFFASFKNAGDIQLRARLSRDDLTLDNDRFAVVNVRPGIRILCVDDEPPAKGDGRMGTYYAVRALRLLEQGADGPIRVHQVQASELSLEKLSNYDIVLMANVADVAPEMVNRIDRFVRDGGGLILFLGDRVNADTYNKRFGTLTSSLLPGELGKTLAADKNNDGWTLAPVQTEHSLGGIVKRLPQEVIDGARFSKLFKVEPAQGSQTILSIAESAAPLLLSRDVGAGSVFLFTTSADRTWNQLPVHPLYTMLLQQAVTNMTSRPEARNVIVGAAAELAVHGPHVGETVHVIDPQKQSVELKVTETGQQPVCKIDMDKVGVYEIQGTKGMPVLLTAANVDPAESDVRVVAPSVLATELEPIGVRVVAQPGALASAIETSRKGRELATVLLICGIVVFVLQSVLAKYFTNRMSQPDTDVAASLQMGRVAAARRS